MNTRSPIHGHLAGLPPAQDVVEQALVEAGGDCVVIVEESSSAEVRFANNTTTTNGIRRARMVTVLRFVETASGTAVGVASRSGEPDIAELVRSATTDARSSGCSDDAAPLVGSGPSPTPFDLGPGDTDLSLLSKALADLSMAFDRAERAATVLAGFAEHAEETVYLGSSTGLRLRYCQPSGAFHLVGRRMGDASSAWIGRGTSDFADLSVERLDEALAKRLEWDDRRTDICAGRYEVILPPAAVADLMIGLVGSASGIQAEQGYTAFSRPGGRTRVGEQLASLPFRLCSDPTELGIECTPFMVTRGSSTDVSVFDNGLTLQPVNWIEGGRLARLRYHRAGAARSGVAATPPIGNLMLELPGATGTIDDLVATTERGLLLTCLWYIREVDAATMLMTGLTRDGVYLVEDGAVKGSVNNFRFNESPVDLIARATEAGTPVRALGREYGEWMNRTIMPPIRVPDFNMSSTSEAS